MLLKFTDLSQRKRVAKVLLFNLNTVLTGGTNLVAPFKSTEYVSADGTITMGPNMPEPIDEHCSVNLDEGRSMLITGETQIAESHLFFPSEFLEEFCLFVCNRGDTVQYHGGLRSRELIVTLLTQ